MANKYPVHKEVVCPFCSLLCDDLVLENRDGRLAMLENGCDRARRCFETRPEQHRPLIKGREVSLDEAVNEAAAVLKAARYPLISGMATDVAGCRAAMQLAERAGAVIDHGQGDAALRNLLTLQESGWVMTTLTELKNRADFVLFLGTDAVTSHPRFFERYIWNESSLFLDRKTSRQLAYIGHRLNTRPGTGPRGEKPLSINCAAEQLIDYVALLTAVLRGHDADTGAISRAQQKKLETLAEQMRAAEYGVVVWAPGELDVAHGELLVQSITDLVRLMNRKRRFAGLSLGGDNGGASFQNVCAWQSGFPFRVDYGSGTPHYDPYGNATGSLLAEGRADALLWVATWPDGPERPATKVPTIVLSGTPDETARVYIPVGMPGVDHPGNLFRTDSVVGLPLKQLREPAGPAADDILTRITGALAS